MNDRKFIQPRRLTWFQSMEIYEIPTLKTRLNTFRRKLVVQGLARFFIILSREENVDRVFSAKKVFSADYVSAL